MTLLAPGDHFPDLTVNLADGATMPIPEVLEGRFGVVLFYRGSWCPYCNAQLRAFQRAQDSLADVGAGLVALSVDDETTTAALIAKLGLTFPVGHSADADALAAAVDAHPSCPELLIEFPHLVAGSTLSGGRSAWGEAGLVSLE